MFSCQLSSRNICLASQRNLPVVHSSLVSMRYADNGN